MRIQHNSINLCFRAADKLFEIQRIVLDTIEAPIPSHCHGEGCFELHYIAEGSGTLLSERRRYALAPGCFYVTGPYVDHAQMSDPNAVIKEYCIYLKLSDAVSAGSDNAFSDDACLLLFAQQRFWHCPDVPELGVPMRAIFQAQRAKQLGFRLEIEAETKKLIVLLTRHYRQPAAPAKTGGSAALENPGIILDEYFLYQYRTASLDELAQRLSLSTRQTERLIRRFYGKTFQQKKADARMAAAVLLLSGPLSITEIAGELGYSSIEHFSSSFRRYYGQSPLRYRTEQLEKS